MSDTVIPADSYDVHVGVGLLERVGDLARAAAPGVHRWAVITDATVGERYAGRVAASFGEAVPVLSIPPGEGEKTRERWAELTDRLLAVGLGRDGGVVALGGGVVGDLAGFVAATYQRGIAWVQVPTTLLAMVDASVGGKTAVDVPAGKNLVGAFHPPAVVVADVLALHTLPHRELRAGLAEVLKHGVIADAAYFEATLAALPDVTMRRGSLDTLAALVARSVAIKVEIVREDPREHGRRATLNFGHTLGHALEHASGFRLLHGEAVAVGMHLEARLGERVGATEPGTAARVLAALREAGLPAWVPPELSPAEVLAATRLDKKSREGRVRYALPARVGAMAGGPEGWARPVDDGDVLAVLAGS